MENTPIEYQVGDQVALLDGSSPMTVTAVKNDGRTITCVSSNEDKPTEQDFDATKLTKLHSGEETGANT
ncbi:hypothetical protein BH09BAC4_BH09BAC4_32700 [soil metagenome]